VRTLFNGRLWVEYGQAYFVTGNDFARDLELSFWCQSNGLCGASSPSLLFLITGLHTGYVNFSVGFTDAEPPLDRSWEDIVEVSFIVDEPPFLEEWGGQASYPIDLAPGNYRVRYSAKGMDSGRAADTTSESGEPVDSYQLIFWPAERTAPDRVIRQESQTAQYWIGWAGSLHPTAKGR
jgi:hypothetical protein